MQILYDSIFLSTKPKAALHYLDFVGSSWETLIQKNILQNIFTLEFMPIWNYDWIPWILDLFPFILK